MLIKEVHGSIYCCDSDTGEVLYELTEPSVIFLNDEFLTLIKIGNKTSLLEYYNRLSLRLKGIDDELFSLYILADLPKDIETLNKAYNNTGYLKVLFKDYIQQLDNK